MRLVLRLVGSALIFFLAAASPGNAAQSGQAGQPPLRHEVTVALKLIHVYVTDRGGRPVRGLKKGDFILRDDGVVREVTDFEEHVPAEAAAETKLVGTPLGAPRLPGRKFLFFFDYGFNTGRGIQRSAKIALDFLDRRLGPRDQVAVATFSGLKGLQVPLLFTSDLKAVRGLVGRIGAFEQSGRIEEIEDRRQQNLKDGAYADARPENVLTWNVPTATGFNPEAEQRHLIRMYLDNLLALARALRYEPGQKHLVFFSEGAPYRSIWRGDQIAVDAKGNSPSQFAEIRKPVDERWDGRYHRIKVEAARPGLSARTLAGYFNPKLFADFSEEERRIQLVDLALAGAPLHQAPMPFAMAAVPIGTAGRPGVRLAASIPWAEIRDAVGSRTGITALAFNALDEIAAERRLVIDGSRLSAVAVPVVSDMLIPPGRYRCRIVVRNLETGRAAVAGMTAVVPPPPDTGIRVLPPLLLRPQRGAGGWKLEPLGRKPTTKTPPSEEAPGPLFDPAQYGPLLGNVLGVGTEIGAEILVVTAGPAEARIRIDAFLIDRLNQERIPLSPTVLARRDDPGGAAFFIRMPLPDVEPDMYTLVITAEDEKSGAKADIRRDYSIEKTPGRS